MAQTIFIICISGFTVTSKTNGTRMARGKCHLETSYYPTVPQKGISKRINV